MERFNKEKRKIEEQFMSEKIFTQLDNLNNGFDSPVISYYTEEGFELVLQRVKQYGLFVYGIEPWLDGEYFDVDTFESYKTTADDPAWYFTSFRKFREAQKGLQYSASYGIPDRVYQEYLKEKGISEK